jgi:hypothetical protein
MNSNPRISGHTDLQNIESIRKHIGELMSDYSRTGNTIVLDFIDDWKYKLKIKQEEQDERCN